MITRSVFEMLADMVRNDDKALRLAPLSNIHEMEIYGGNGFVTFGVEPNVVMELSDKDKQFVGGFILVEKSALKKYEKKIHPEL